MCLSACLSFYLSVCLSACLSVCLPVCLTACLWRRLTAEVWRESVREDSEGRQTATEPNEPAREPLGPPPLPSRMVALVKEAWSKLCYWWKKGKKQEEGRRDRMGGQRG